MEKERRQSASSSRVARMTLTYVVLFALILFGIYAITHLIAAALQPGAQPLSVSVGNVLHGSNSADSRVLFLQPGFLRWLGSSSLVALSVTISGVALASSIGYMLSRFRSRGSSVAVDALVTRLLPAGVLLLALLVILFEIGLLKSYFGVLIIYSLTALPFCVWQMKSYYDAIPSSLEEAAAVDGATRWQIFRFVIFPLAAPATLIAALFSFLTAWNEYIIAGIRFRNAKLFALPSGSELFLSNMGTRWGSYAAGAVAVGITVVILFAILGHLVSQDR